MINSTPNCRHSIYLEDVVHSARYRKSSTRYRVLQYSTEFKYSKHTTEHCVVNIVHSIAHVVHYTQCNRYSTQYNTYST